MYFKISEVWLITIVAIYTKIKHFITLYQTALIETHPVNLECRQEPGSESSLFQTSSWLRPHPTPGTNKSSSRLHAKENCSYYCSQFVTLVDFLSECLSGMRNQCVNLFEMVPSWFFMLDTVLLFGPIWLGICWAHCSRSSTTGIFGWKPLFTHLLNLVTSLCNK